MKETLWRRFLILFFGVVFLCAFASPASAVYVEWTDDGTYEPSYGGSNTIVYSLSFDDTLDPTFPNASFRITTEANVGPPEWRVGWVAFKFSPAGGEIDLGSLLPSANAGAWTIADPGDSVPWGPLGPTGDMTPFAGSWAGFYADGLIAADGVTGGPLLTAGAVTYIFGFDFEIDDAGKVFTEEMPFKVGFYDAFAGPKVKTDQLSENLSVPEPATMLLLGAGLIGLAGLGRKRFVKKT